MGKSVVDLPDPLEQNGSEPLTTTAPAQVDDLLAQMAGDEIDRLLAESDHPRDPGPEAPAPTGVPAVAVVVSSPSAMPNEQAGDDEGATTAAERSALEIPPEQIAIAAPPGVEAPLFSLEENAAAEDADRPLPFYLKPLAWLNAPLESLPEGVRDGIGKIALLTLFNAVAVLIYVLVFRKRH